MPLDEGAFAIAIDSSGNAYVTGEGRNREHSDNIGITLKYDTNGTQLWVARYNGFSCGDSTKAIALDEGGNVYVAGHTFGGDDRYSGVTIKYAST